MLARVAGEFRTTLPWDRTAELLATRGPGSGDAPPALSEQGGRRPESLERAERGERYLRAADELFEGPLRRVVPWLESVGVTGSTAYGEPEPGDDLDFYLITRPGTLPVVLAGTYLALRLEQARRGRLWDPPPCFNYVVDARRAAEDLAAGEGLLFQREALTAHILLGDEFYRGLLSRTPSLGADFPRLYAARTEGARAVPPRSAPRTLRALSALVFVPLAAYLQLVGLRRNARARRQGDLDAQFRTITTPERVAFQSRRFERIRRLYEEPERERMATAPPASTSSAR